MENRYRFWCRETAFIYNKCLVDARDSVKHHCQRRKNPTAIWQCRTSRMLTTNMQNGLEDLEIKNMEKYLDIYLRSKTWWLKHLFESFRNRSVKIYELHPAYFLWALGLAWQVCLINASVKLELLTDIL